MSNREQGMAWKVREHAGIGRVDKAIGLKMNRYKHKRLKLGKERKNMQKRVSRWHAVV